MIFSFTMETQHISLPSNDDGEEEVEISKTVLMQQAHKFSGAFSSRLMNNFSDSSLSRERANLQRAFLNAYPTKLDRVKV